MGIWSSTQTTCRTATGTHKHELWIAGSELRTATSQPVRILGIIEQIRGISKRLRVPVPYERAKIQRKERARYRLREIDGAWQSEFCPLDCAESEGYSPRARQPF